MRQFPHVPNSNVAPIQLPAPDFVVKGNSGNLRNGRNDGDIDCCKLTLKSHCKNKPPHPNHCKGEESRWCGREFRSHRKLAQLNNHYKLQ